MHCVIYNLHFNYIFNYTYYVSFDQAKILRILNAANSHRKHSIQHVIQSKSHMMTHFSNFSVVTAWTLSDHLVDQNLTVHWVQKVKSIVFHHLLMQILFMVQVKMLQTD